MMKKYQKVESVVVLSDQEQSRINYEVMKLGKRSALELSDEERELLKPE